METIFLQWLENHLKLQQLKRPGAVHIELPEDIAAEEVEYNIYQ